MWPRRPSNDNADGMEMTQVVDVDAYIATLDGRFEIDNDIECSSSSDSNESQLHSMQRNSYYNPVDSDDHADAIEPYREAEEEERLMADDIESQQRASLEKSGTSKGWTCFLFLALLLVGWMIGTIILSRMDPNGNDESKLLKLLSFDDVYNTSFVPRRESLNWVKNDPRDGIFTYRVNNTSNIMLESIEDGKAQIFVKASDLHIGKDLLDVYEFEMSQDGKYLMLWTNVTQQWRHSFFSTIYIYNIADKSLTPLVKPSTNSATPRVGFARWSPTGHRVAYVMHNDLYVTDLVESRQVTFDGSATVFNGVPDWVYEEEVLMTNFALWWSPDSTHIAYLRFNETSVPEYHLQYYTTSNASYPEEVSLKYPKAGSPNPLVSLHVYSMLSHESVMVTRNTTSTGHLQSVDDYKDFEDDDRIISDVAWITESSTYLVFKQTNRVQDHEMTSLVTVSKQLNESSVELVRRYEPTDGGWVDLAQTMVYVPVNGSNQVHFLDIVDDGKGFMHLALFTVNEGKESKPQWLTSGEWEVLPGTVIVDEKRQLIHYVSTERSSMERHLYTLSLGSDVKKCLSCPENPEEHGFYSASFSPLYGYYVLDYEGPGIPRSIVRKVDDSSFESVLEDNADLNNLLQDYALPRKRMVTVKSGGIEMNAMEMLPPNFDPKKKYPVLFHVYGGPGSQMVSYEYELGWHTFMSSALNYIIVRVDGRGTGFRGRAYRVGVHGRLGELEAIDQINAAKHWAELEYVDQSRIAIWGWSYGGYLTSKVIEANSGAFAVGMAVAPVTDWRFYDSVYTERYMLTPKMNPKGYETSAVSNMTGFANASYLLVHGTGDDNVHFQHSAVLVDKLTMASVHNYRVQFFPDSNHHMEHHNANKNVYFLLAEYLWESFGGQEYMHVWRETKGRFEGKLQEHA